MSIRAGDLRQKSSGEQLLIIEQALKAAQNEKRVALIEQVGYTKEKFNHAWSLIEKIYEQRQKQQLAIGRKLGLRDERDKAILDAHRNCGVTWTTVQTVLNDDSAKFELGLHNRRARPKNIAPWLEQHDRFYRNFSEELITSLNEWGITAERIEREHKVIKDIMQIEKDRVDCAGVSQRATAEQNRLLAELQQWASQFFKLAKIAYRESPQMMEALGILARS